MLYNSVDESNHDREEVPDKSAWMGKGTTMAPVKFVLTGTGPASHVLQHRGKEISHDQIISAGKRSAAIFAE